jgi:dCMP deaminase
MSDIPYPYLPAEHTILYVAADNPFMQEAKEFAKVNNTVKQVGAAVIVQDGQIIGRGSIGAGIHGKQGGCIREKMNVPTGTQYELCEGCGHEYHSEVSAIHDAKTGGENTRDADLYLWGHWWCCEDCWKAMLNAGIKNVYLLEGSEKLFNKEHPGNIIGHQFE